MIKSYWVKEQITDGDYKSKYAELSCYTKLNDFGRGRGSGVEVGFVIGLREGEKIPAGCEEMSDDELRVVQLDREGKNNYPQPNEGEESWKNTTDDYINREKTRDKLKQMKEELINSGIFRR